MTRKTATLLRTTAVMAVLALLLAACQLALNLKKEYPPESDGSIGDGADSDHDLWQDPDGEGVPGLCTPGTVECQGDVLAVCNAEGTGWITMPCQFGCNADRFECNACRPGESTCDGDDLVTCDADGLGHTTTSCPLGCSEDAAPSRCYSLNPSNVNDAALTEPLLCAGTAPLDLSADAVINTASGTITGVDASSLVFNVLILHGSEIAVFSFDSVTVRAGVTVLVEGTRPLVLLSCGDVTIAGRLDASAAGREAGPGGFAGGLEDTAGSGCAGGRPGNSGITNTDSGGSGGSFGAMGGTGGPAYIIPGPTAPPACSELAGLVPLTGGSGGGGGGRQHSGYGGGGGGAIQITSGTSITVAPGAVISANGAGGGRGLRQDPNYGAGGGGGSGGGILLEAASVVMAGGLFANGGGGGGGVCTNVSGTNGEDGLHGTTPAQGGRGGDRGGDGGDGGAGTAEDGGNGGTCPESGFNGGGGGGASGFIRIHALSDESITFDGATTIISPSDDSSSCAGLCSLGTVDTY